MSMNSLVQQLINQRLHRLLLLSKARRLLETVLMRLPSWRADRLAAQMELSLTATRPLLTVRPVSEDGDTLAYDDAVVSICLQHVGSRLRGIELVGTSEYFTRNCVITALQLSVNAQFLLSIPVSAVYATVGTDVRWQVLLDAGNSRLGRFLLDELAHLLQEGDATQWARVTTTR